MYVVRCKLYKEDKNKKLLILLELVIVIKENK